MCKLSDKVGQHMKKRSPGCKYACHAACRDRVSLDCHPAASPFSQDQLNNNTLLQVNKSSPTISCGNRTPAAGLETDEPRRSLSVWLLTCPNMADRAANVTYSCGQLSPSSPLKTLCCGLVCVWQADNLGLRYRPFALKAHCK
ncbi:hypothetical protein JOQ06_003514 [Pogonophryne albipinna]|uniref:Uncharacterized protein n=1 Tax=Pogonophryne albipinna TaxID=1090488 RepID=A0AAD6AFX1_9TELE|nr:hypothetical protein JOQ06_003514 [Pogonophryne albipinna]